MRLRSSVGCSKKVMAPAGSSAGGGICELESDSSKDSGRAMGALGSFLRIGDRSRIGLDFGRLFRRAWNRFGNRRDYRIFGGVGFCLSLGRGRFCTCRLRGCCRLRGLGGGRSGGFFGGLFARRLECLALHFAHFFFECALKVGGGLAELSHKLAQAAGKFRQLLWPKNDQNHNKHYNHVRNAQHCAWETSNRSVGIIEREPVAVKPELAVCYNINLSCRAR